MPNYYGLDLDRNQILDLGKCEDFEVADEVVRSFEKQGRQINWILNEDTLLMLSDALSVHAQHLRSEVGGLTKLLDGDYLLTEGCGWFEVKGFAIRIHHTDEGVVVDVFDSAALSNGDTEAIVASTYAFDSELGGEEE